MTNPRVKLKNWTQTDRRERGASSGRIFLFLRNKKFTGCGFDTRKVAETLKKKPFGEIFRGGAGVLKLSRYVVEVNGIDANIRRIALLWGTPTLKETISTLIMRLFKYKTLITVDNHIICSWIEFQYFIVTL